MGDDQNETGSKQYFATLRKCILDMEKEYNQRMEHIDGIEQAERTLREIERVRQERLCGGHDVAIITKFLLESREYFEEMTAKSIEDDTFVFNFAQWAKDTQRDIRAQSASMAEGMPSSISVASICEDGRLGTKSTNPSQPRSWKKLSAAPRTVHNAGVKTMKSFIQILLNNGKLSPEDRENAPPDQAKKLFCLSTSAWSFAVIGLLFALGFLTNDFYSATTNLAIQQDRKATPTMPYPAVTVCADIPRVPLFSDFPSKKYPGKPLFGLSAFLVRNSSRGKMSKIKFPDTIPSPRNGFEEIVSGPEPTSCRDMKKQTSIDTDQKALFTLGDFFNTTKIEQRKRKGSLDSSKECYWCLRVGASSKIGAQYVDSHGSGPNSPPYQLNFFRSKFVEGCTTLSGFRNREIRALIAVQLRAHARALMERRVLDFDDYPPENTEYDALLTVENGFKYHALGGGDYEAGMEFACNVYFYSGYFYPTEGTPDIRYRFVHANKSWVQTGRGPFFKTKVWDVNAKDIIGPGHSGVEIDRYTTHHAQILFQDPDLNISHKFVPISAKIVNIESSTALFLDVERRAEYGKIGYIVDVQSTGTQTSSHSRGFSHFSVGLAYRSNFTQSIASVSTMAWSSYLTDVFEFIGLFTGVCVFTLLIAPAHTLVQ